MNNRIVVPSLGRCGSTAVTFAIAAAFPELSETFARHPNYFPARGVIKTHCWAPPVLNSDDRYIYVFGDPVASAISVHLQSIEFQTLHYAHMGGNFELRQYWDTEDTLHIQQNYESWKGHEGETNLIFLSYDEIFTGEGEDRVSRFLGRKIQFPRREARAAIFDVSNPKHINAARTYGGIL